VAAVVAFVFAFFALAAYIAIPDKGAADTKVSITLYQSVPTTVPTPSPGSTVTPTVSPGATITVTTKASPICAIIQKRQPTPPPPGTATPALVVVEPDATATPSQVVTIPVPSIAGMAPDC
jgi:hypothetical protein